MAGTAIFVIGSILAALSDSSSGLIWARVVQGVGGAMVLPSTLSTVNATFRGSARAAAFGVWGAVMSRAAALGPLLGGGSAGTRPRAWPRLRPADLSGVADVPVAQSGQGSATQSTVRQIGSAMGSAVSGALLSVGLFLYLSTGTPYDQAVRNSAGGALQGLRAQGGQDTLVAQLSNQLADGARLALFGSVIFLLLALAGSIQVLRASRVLTSLNPETVAATEP